MCTVCEIQAHLKRHPNLAASPVLTSWQMVVEQAWGMVEPREGNVRIIKVFLGRRNFWVEFNVRRCQTVKKRLPACIWADTTHVLIFSLVTLKEKQTFSPLQDRIAPWCCVHVLQARSCVSGISASSPFPRPWLFSSVVTLVRRGTRAVSTWRQETLGWSDGEQSHITPETCTQSASWRI